ncbi:MAG: hypothetical protein IRY91_16740, partial [Gemmatimonadaceae bacterium]|nr:hypothetical protein [Gemmatimonadaceae bacterium]
PLPLLLLSAALALSACLDDTPVGPANHSTVALRVSMQVAPATGRLMHIQVVSFTQRSETPIYLFDDTVPLTRGEHSIRAAFDLTPCLSAFPPDSIGPYCPINVELDLISDGTVLDSKFAGPLYARPGRSVETPQMLLVAGNTPPQLTAVDTAVLLEPGLIKFRLAGSDPDGDLLTVMDQLIDVSGLFVGGSAFDLPAATASFHGDLFTFANPAQSPQIMLVTLMDSKANISATDTVTVVAAMDILGMGGIATDTTADSVSVTLQPFDQTGTADSVEVVFRNVVDTVTTFTDSIYFVCGAKYDPKVTGPTIKCKRTVPFTRAIAIAFPITPAGDWGMATECPVPGDCLVGFRRTRE